MGLFYLPFLYNERKGGNGILPLFLLCKDFLIIYNRLVYWNNQYGKTTVGCCNHKENTTFQTIFLMHADLKISLDHADLHVHIVSRNDISLTAVSNKVEWNELESLDPHMISFNPLKILI